MNADVRARAGIDLAVLDRDPFGGAALVRLDLLGVDAEVDADPIGPRVVNTEVAKGHVPAGPDGDAVRRLRLAEVAVVDHEVRVSVDLDTFHHDVFTTVDPERADHRVPRASGDGGEVDHVASIERPTQVDARAVTDNLKPLACSEDDHFVASGVRARHRVEFGIPLDEIFTGRNLPDPSTCSVDRGSPCDERIVGVDVAGRVRAKSADVERVKAGGLE